MAAMCYEFSKQDGDKNTIWSSNYNIKSTDNTQDQESDVQSEYSFRATKESNPNKPPDIKARMKKLFESQSFTDVIFYPKNNRSVSISAHRAVLAISNPFFTKMLYNDQNKITIGSKLEVQISNLSFDAFTRIIKYLYTDEISFDNEALVQGILDGAKQFGIFFLVDKCTEYFEEIELTKENVCSKLQMSTSNKIVVLKDRCIEFIQRNTHSVIQSCDFQKSSPVTVQAICKLQSLNIRNEMELLQAVMKWLNSQPHHERKNLLKPLLKCIRFLNFTAGEMGDAIKKYPDLMTAEEGLKIMVFLSNPPKNPNFTSLPSWCNKNMLSRCSFKEDVRGSQIGLNPGEGDPNGQLEGKICFPLKPDLGQGFVPKLTSLLQMTCISGCHQIKAIRLSFQNPMSEKCRIKSLFIKVHVRPSGFNATKTVQIRNSETVRVEFKRTIKARRGDIVDIEAEAKNIELYRFLEFDEKNLPPSNPHFDVCIANFPKLGKLYFISEIEYETQGASKRLGTNKR